MFILKFEKDFQHHQISSLKIWLPFILKGRCSVGEEELNLLDK
jgi:hypothetical protein